jgi:hypothetical protein
MATNTTPARTGKGVPHPTARKYDRLFVAAQVCEGLKKGRSLDDICSNDAGMPATSTFLEWIEKDDPPGIAEQYTHAREIGYSLLADEIVALSDKTHEWVTVHKLSPDGDPVYDEKGEPVLKKMLMPLNSDVIAHKRVQIDTRKWMLSKMLPKVYGDKITQEHTGSNGGPIALAAVDLKNLSDEELENMSRLLAKAGQK